MLFLDNAQECEEELTQKGEMVSRLQAKTSQIGQLLSSLQKHNHLLRDPPPKTEKSKKSEKSPSSNNENSASGKESSKNVEKSERKEE